MLSMSDIEWAPGVWPEGVRPASAVKRHSPFPDMSTLNLRSSATWEGMELVDDYDKDGMKIRGSLPMRLRRALRSPFLGPRARRLLLTSHTMPASAQVPHWGLTRSPCIGAFNGQRVYF